MESEKLSQEAGWFVNTHDLADRRPDESPEPPDPKPKVASKPPLLLAGGCGLLVSVTMLGVFFAFLWSQ